MNNFDVPICYVSYLMRLTLCNEVALYAKTRDQVIPMSLFIRRLRAEAHELDEPNCPFRGPSRLKLQHLRLPFNFGVLETLLNLAQPRSKYYPMLLTSSQEGFMFRGWNTFEAPGAQEIACQPGANDAGHLSKHTCVRLIAIFEGSAGLHDLLRPRYITRRN